MSPDLQRASDDVDRFFVAARDLSEFATRNHVYTSPRAYFRRFAAACLSRGDRVRGVLSPLLRAIFVSGWDIHDVAVALRRNIDVRALEAMLAGAAGFWAAQQP
jgi:hypothetical protein